MYNCDAVVRVFVLSVYLVVNDFCELGLNDFTSRDARRARMFLFAPGDAEAASIDNKTGGPPCNPFGDGGLASIIG